VGTEKRERQKANRAKRREEELKAARTTKVKRTALRWVLAAVLALAAVVLIAWIGGAFEGDDEPAVPTLPAETLPINVTIPTTLPSTAPPASLPAGSVPALSAPATGAASLPAESPATTAASATTAP
jgi:hypothetical protein